jgi:arylsulfatase A-like enzyme
MDIYDETLYQIDQKVKDLLDFVEQPEIKRKTIVIIFSDNGEDFTEHSFFDHGWNIYNTATHAPFIMAAPRVRSGVFHQLIQAIDMYPTLLNLVGIRPIAPLEGQSIVPVLEGRGEQHIGERYLIGQHRGDNIVSIRNSRWKMYKNNTTEKHYVELYDLLTDPLEQHNILGKHLDIAGRLDTALIGILKGSPKYASVSGEFPAWMDEEKRKELIEEGYF